MGNQVVFNAKTAENALNNTGLIGLSNTSEVKTMSSLEIAELTGKDHRNVMRDIKVMFEQLDNLKGLLSFEHTYTHHQNGQKYKCYHLPKNETLCLVSGYSPQMRMAIIKRWQELEEANKSNGIFMPNFSDPVEAAIAWANEKRLSRMLEQKIEEQKPKVEYVEKYVERNNTKNITATAKEIGISGRKLGEWLRKKDYAFKRTDKLVWKQQFIDEGYGVMKQTVKNEFDTSQALFTAAGDLFIKTKYAEDGSENVTNKAPLQLKNKQ